MASSAHNRSLLARASAVLTTSEVAATRIDLNECRGSEVSVDIDFTLGMLTNGIFRFYVSMDGTTYVPFDMNGAAAVSYTLTATATRAVTIRAPGWKYFRLTVQGTGTVTDSLADITYRYLRRGT